MAYCQFCSSSAMLRSSSLYSIYFWQYHSAEYNIIWPTQNNANRILDTAQICSALLQTARICNTTNPSNFSSIYKLDWSKFLSRWATKHNFTPTKWTDTSFINLHIHKNTAKHEDTTVHTQCISLSTAQLK